MHWAPWGKLVPSTMNCLRGFARSGRFTRYNQHSVALLDNSLASGKNLRRPDWSRRFRQDSVDGHFCFSIMRDQINVRNIMWPVASNSIFHDVCSPSRYWKISGPTSSYIRVEMLKMLHQFGLHLNSLSDITAIFPRNTFGWPACIISWECNGCSMLPPLYVSEHNPPITFGAL